MARRHILCSRGFSSTCLPRQARLRRRAAGRCATARCHARHAAGGVARPSEARDQLADFGRQHRAPFRAPSVPGDPDPTLPPALGAEQADAQQQRAGGDQRASARGHDDDVAQQLSARLGRDDRYPQRVGQLEQPVRDIHVHCTRAGQAISASRSVSALQAAGRLLSQPTC